MMRSNRISSAFAWCCLCGGAVLAACSGEPNPATQTIVEIDAEPSVEAATSHAGSLLVIVTGSDSFEHLADSKRVRMALEQSIEPARFPWRVSVRPSGKDSERAFSIAATALDREGTPVARARLVSGYVARETRYARIILEDDCIGVPVCDGLATCRAGRCIDATLSSDDLSRDSNRPAMLRAAAVSRDAGSDGSSNAAATDAQASPGLDAGIDASAGGRESETTETSPQDAAVRDASVRDGAVGDAGKTGPSEPADVTPTDDSDAGSSSCADSQACTPDYPCLERPDSQDYVCRGQFPEWHVPVRPGPYTVQGDVVTDMTTRLQWQRITATDAYIWRDAKHYCDELVLAGFRDWRLPAKVELESLVDDAAQYPAIDTTLFSDTPSEGGYWSSTPNARDPGFAWMVSFSIGYSNADEIIEPLRVRCVR